MRQLNQLNLAEIIPEKVKNISEIEETKVEAAPAKNAIEPPMQIVTDKTAQAQQTKSDYLNQIREAREKAATMEFKFAEEDVIKKFEEQQQIEKNQRNAKIKEKKEKIV